MRSQFKVLSEKYEQVQEFFSARNLGLPDDFPEPKNPHKPTDQEMDAIAKWLQSKPQYKQALDMAYSKALLGQLGMNVPGNNVSVTQALDLANPHRRSQAEIDADIKRDQKLSDPVTGTSPYYIDPVDNRLKKRLPKKMDEAAYGGTPSLAKGRYIYFVDINELYQLNPFKQIQPKGMIMTMANNWTKVMVMQGEEVRDLLGMEVDDTSKWYVVNSAPGGRAFVAYIGT